MCPLLLWCQSSSTLRARKWLSSPRHHLQCGSGEVERAVLNLFDEPNEKKATSQQEGEEGGGESRRDLPRRRLSEPNFRGLLREAELSLASGQVVRTEKGQNFT